MCDEWMPTIELPLTLEQFQQLPRNAAYHYRHVDGKAVLAPGPRHYHAELELQEQPVPAGLGLRPVRQADWPALVTLFAAAFRTVQPFGSLDEPTRHLAAAKCLEKTRTRGDGPWIEPASFVADPDGRLRGAILVTLLPPGNPLEVDDYYWRQPPPADCVARCQGRPHLTWIFVSPMDAGQGVGSALLAAASSQLRAMGFSRLLSTFLLGNDTSPLWHWRNGFRLLPYPWSRRRNRALPG